MKQQQQQIFIQRYNNLLRITNIPIIVMQNKYNRRLKSKLKIQKIKKNLVQNNTSKQHPITPKQQIIINIIVRQALQNNFQTSCYTPSVLVFFKGVHQLHNTKGAQYVGTY
eukprot:TRINITY_DN3465_c1_g5_i1.p4 TRINITY_DN3465_c1_g5~~TRINITY_DN3465_c1_g5_i1.p4  ORF type:complete len:111 (+),score=0.85 TRINITY_DN3465_c1_g5_i1:700-1032(+)